MRDVGHHEAPQPLWRELITDPGLWVAVGLVVLAITAGVLLAAVRTVGR